MADGILLDYNLTNVTTFSHLTGACDTVNSNSALVTFHWINFILITIVAVSGKNGKLFEQHFCIAYAFAMKTAKSWFPFCLWFLYVGFVAFDLLEYIKLQLEVLKRLVSNMNTYISAEPLQIGVHKMKYRPR